MKRKKIALAIFTRNIKEKSPIQDFLDNAKKYNHQIDHLIIVYNDYVDKHIIDSYKTYCPVTAIQLGNKFFIHQSLKEIGISERDINAIINTPNLKKFDLVPYGTARNHALLTALYYGFDYLFFFDSDVYPKLLTDFCENDFHFKEIDFIGSHLKYLKQKNVVVTTSDYSGYYIIPKMNFPYLMELLRGLQKEDSYQYISTVDAPVTRNVTEDNVFDTRKALGGNMAIDLNKFSLLPPFFSSTLIINDQCFLGRGEDTLFGPLIYNNGGRCVDIDLLLFHNCFGDFPNKPTINLQKNVDRFFYACMGWIIRNPFFNWLHKEYGITTEEIDTDNRLASLKLGAKSAAKYFGDNRFLMLPDAFVAAYNKLPEEIEKFHNLMNAWKTMKTKLAVRR
ncbi:MAG: hypothetical protein DRH79_06695 [Candidatus Cloacimonadota bacterium]|nr:MAG: hypothetical protein DRH79_06695 [Candidatus Cloacimonadota bacterium]